MMITYRGMHFVMDTIVKSLHCALKTNRILYNNDFLVKKKLVEKKGRKQGTVK